MCRARGEAHNEPMARQKRRKKAARPLEAYRRVRKPMPPPEQAIPDKRRKLDEEEGRRELRGGS